MDATRKVNPKPKPQPLQRRSLMNFFEVIAYISDTYNISERRYLKYSKWVLNYFGWPHNGGTEYWNVTAILQEDRTPMWVKRITLHVSYEFNHLFDEDGGFEVLTKWE